MEPLPWKWALFVWVYALAWALVNDRVKLLAYWILDRTQAGETPEARAQAKLDAKAEAKPEAKAEAEPDAKAEAKPEAETNGTPEAKPTAKPETPPDLTPQIANRAYELYDERRRGVQDWEKAEREIRKDGSPK